MAAPCSRRPARVVASSLARDLLSYCNGCLRYLTRQVSLAMRWSKKKWRHRGSNAGPLDLQSNALPTELCHRLSSRHTRVRGLPLSSLSRGAFPYDKGFSTQYISSKEWHHRPTAVGKMMPSVLKNLVL